MTLVLMKLGCFRELFRADAPSMLDMRETLSAKVLDNARLAMTRRRALPHFCHERCILVFRRAQLIRRPLFCALAATLGLVASGQGMAATTHKRSEAAALRAMLDHQQRQMDAQQHQIQILRERLQQLETLQYRQPLQTETQVAAEAAPPPSTSASKPVFHTAPGVSIALHGFASTTAFSQNKSFIFGNGQNAEFPKPGSHGSLSGIDVRNTRFWLDVAGAKFTQNWSGGARIEMDFFGGYNGTGAFSQQQPIPRLRQAYLSLTNPASGTTIKIGQQWDLMFPIDNLPGSPTHIAFPLGLGTGIVGWRFPGFVVMQDLSEAGSGTQWRLDVGVFNGSWSGPGDNDDFETAGNVSFHPQVQARIHFESGDWLAYASHTWAKNELAGIGNTTPTPIQNSVFSSGLQIGANWHPANWTVAAGAYTGKGMGQIFGNLVQFGDISENGGYLSVGYRFTPCWSAHTFFGYSRSDRKDLNQWLGHGAVGRLKNHQSALSVEYAAGSYKFGMEYLHDTLGTIKGMGNSSTNGSQLSLSALYSF